MTFWKRVTAAPPQEILRHDQEIFLAADTMKPLTNGQFVSMVRSFHAIIGQDRQPIERTADSLLRKLQANNTPSVMESQLELEARSMVSRQFERDEVFRKAARFGELRANMWNDDREDTDPICWKCGGTLTHHVPFIVCSECGFLSFLEARHGTIHYRDEAERHGRGLIEDDFDIAPHADALVSLGIAAEGLEKTISRLRVERPTITDAQVVYAIYASTAKVFVTGKRLDLASKTFHRLGSFLWDIDEYHYEADWNAAVLAAMALLADGDTHMSITAPPGCDLCKTKDVPIGVPTRLPVPRRDCRWTGFRDYGDGLETLIVSGAVTGRCRGSIVVGLNPRRVDGRS